MQGIQDSKIGKLSYCKIYRPMKKYILIVILMHMLGASLFAQAPKVMVMEIKDEIDPPMTRYISLALRHAQSIQADFVVIDMNTYGGALTDAKDIAKLLLDFKKPIWVYVNSNAISAGALISIACDSIYMSPGASIGAATVVSGDGKKAIDKYQSGMRSFMRATAEENHRDPQIAEGMVDEDLEIPGVKKAGQIITFSTSEALTNGYCEGKFETLQDLLNARIPNHNLEKFELGTADSIIAFFLNPFISSILILMILGGIYFEIQTPGLGLAGALALVALILYLVPYYLNGLAENWEVIALFVGIILLAVEIFVLPGFGVAGISGAILIIGSLALIMLNNDVFDFQFVAMNDIIIAIAVSSGGMMGATVLFFVAAPRMFHSKRFSRIALMDTQDSTKGYTAKVVSESLKGRTGVAHTVLRPSGKVLIDGEVFDAFTRGEYIEKDEPIEVVGDETTSLRVRRISA